jgi:Protein of unknown function (DUF1501)
MKNPFVTTVAGEQECPQAGSARPLRKDQARLGPAHGIQGHRSGATAYSETMKSLRSRRDFLFQAGGLLDSTLVVWHGEVGRMPISQRGVGRDNNPGAMSMWMAGARVKGGQDIGASDEFGYKAKQQPVSIHDLHAMVLHRLGMDHTKLTYLYNGRNMRLTDVYGDPIPQIVSG